MTGVTDPRPAEIRHAEIRAELARVLGSDDFLASDRNRRFLSWICEETLAGRGDRIKAYAIATQVFGRPDDFDPQIDPIVRIEARRVRAALERFYLLHNEDDALRITIPKGSYVPAFERAGPVAPTAEPAPTPEVERSAAAIRVAMFLEETEAGERPDPAFTRRLLVGLTWFTELHVFGPSEIDAQSAPAAVDVLLAGSVAEIAGALHVDALLTDARTGRHLWSDSWERAIGADGRLAAREALASLAARKLGQVYGPVFARAAAEAGARPWPQRTARDGVVEYYHYMRHFERDRFAEIRDRLEAAVRDDPGHAEATACLALLYVDAHRFAFPHGGPFDPLKRALALARRAVDLAPFSSRARQALGAALWFSRDVRVALATLEAACELNPNDPEAQMELGLRLAIRGEFARSEAHLRRALEQNPEQPGHFHFGMALHAWADGRAEDALDAARRVDAPDVSFTWIMRAICAEAAGETQEAREAVERLLRIDPAYGARAEADLLGRNVLPELMERIVAALRRAGLPRPAPADAAAVRR